MNTWRDKDNELVGLLKYQLAETTNLNDHFLSARLHETIRCMKMFDIHGYEQTKKHSTVLLTIIKLMNINLICFISCQKLIGALKEDYKSRAPYITYLVKCRKTLLTSIAQLNR